MASSFLYHVTPTANVKSILGAGLQPRAGVWHGPGRRLPDDHKRILKLLKMLGQWVLPECDGSGFVTGIRFTSRHATEYLRKLGALGMSFGIPVTEWTPRVFLATSIMSAYDIAYEFSLDGHHPGPFAIIAVSRSLIPGTLHPDTHVHFRKDDGGLRIRRKQRGSCITYEPIPASALVAQPDVPTDLLKMAAFRRWIVRRT
jgi:hypothetical protein